MRKLLMFVVCILLGGSGCGSLLIGHSLDLTPPIEHSEVLPKNIEGDPDVPEPVAPWTPPLSQQPY